MNALFLGKGAGLRHGTPGWCTAGPERSVLVLGPPRCGKTSALAIPNVLLADGSVVVTSTKPDVAASTVRARQRRGRCWWWDPSGSLPPPPGTTPLSWSPVAGCDCWETAVTRAHLLASAAQPGRGVVDQTHWVNRAEALLAPLLHAAGVMELSLRWVMRWVLSHEVSEAAAILEARGAEMARESLGGVLASEDRERSGIFSTAAAILSAYRSESALAATEGAGFDPASFVSGTETLYVCAPARIQDQLAPLVVGLLDEIRAAAYANQDRAPVVWVLDEVAQVAPIPFLPQVAAEGGGQGLLLLACLQDLSQARARWGPAADGFLSLFGAKVVFPGIGDRQTLELVSALAGEHRVRMRSRTRPSLFSRSGPSVTDSWIWRPRLPVDQVRRGWPGQAVVVDAERPVELLELAPYYATPELAALAGVPTAPSTPAPNSSPWTRARRWWRRRSRRQRVALVVVALCFPLRVLVVAAALAAAACLALADPSGWSANRNATFRRAAQWWASRPKWLRLGVVLGVGLAPYRLVLVAALVGVVFALARAVGSRAGRRR